MGLEVPDRFDRIPDMITAQEFIYAATCTFKYSTRGWLGGGLEASVLVGEMLLLLASGIRH